MNNPNPFVPKGSLLEQQNQRRSRLKLAVFCVLAVSVTGLVAMLIQGCKRENPDQSLNNPPVETNTPSLGMPMPPAAETNVAALMTPVVSNAAPVVAPPVVTQPVVAPPVEPAAASTYEVVQGDTLGKIAKAHGVTLKALEAANPGVDSKKLKLKQKLNIPASTKSAEAVPVAPAGAVAAGGDVYTVKSGDTLSKIAKAHGTTIKAIQAENSLPTTKIKVGQKLKVPAKTEAAAATPTPEPAPAPMSVPAPTPAPVK